LHAPASNKFKGLESQKSDRFGGLFFYGNAGGNILQISLPWIRPLPVPMAETTALKMITPKPGTVINRRQASSSMASASISCEKTSIRASKSFHSAERRGLIWKGRLRLRERIEVPHQKGQSPAEIARYVHNGCGSSWSKKYPWAMQEREELERLDLEVAERKARKAAKAGQPAAEAAARHAEWLASRTPDPPDLGREGLSSADVLEILGCKGIELDRWAADSPLLPNGRKFYHNVGGTKSPWGRAWQGETVDHAKAYVEEWRARNIAEMMRRAFEAALFNLVHSRLPDAVRWWSPDWLGGQSVDTYVHSINVAFEYQGKQHYKPVIIFGGERTAKEIAETRQSKNRCQYPFSYQG
jgi:hypothetical protein